VDKYSSSRPDGFMDVLRPMDWTVSNVTATFDSAFLKQRVSRRDSISGERLQQHKGSKTSFLDTARVALGVHLYNE